MIGLIAMELNKNTLRDVSFCTGICINTSTEDAYEVETTIPEVILNDRRYESYAAEE